MSAFCQPADHQWKHKAVEQSWVRLCIKCGKVEQIEKPDEDYDGYVERRKNENAELMRQKLKIVKKR